MLIAISIYFIIGGLIAEIAVRNSPRTIGFVEYLIATTLWPIVLFLIFNKGE